MRNVWYGLHALLLRPVAYALRLFGIDPLRRRFDPAAETYWRKSDISTTGAQRGRMRSQKRM